jgi:UDP-glucose 4-epimerase
VKILITGGAGFLGSHLCDKYVGEGNTVICFDNFMTGSMENIHHLLSNKNFILVNRDIRDNEIVEQVAKDVDVIIHLAAQIHVDRSAIEPRMTVDINVIGTQNILEAARKFDIKKVINASTSEVYGSAQYSPMDEKHPLNAPHVYGASKIAAERLCNSYIKTYGMNIAVTRCFNFFGPRQRDFEYGSVIPIFIKRMLNNEPPQIYGDGNQLRDYTYIKDIVDVYDLILKHEARLDEPLNFGTGRDVKVRDIADMVMDLVGGDKRVVPVHTNARTAEVSRLIADSSKQKAILGWEPKYTFEQGLAEFVDWYRNYKYKTGAKRYG